MTPRVFPWPANEPQNLRAGMQGQSFLTVMEGAGQLSKVIIVMRSRQVSNVHLHRDTDVYVDVLSADGQGALTLAGWELEHAVWVSQYQTLHLPPGVPHVAVYPGPPQDSPWWPAPYRDLVAMETRTNPVADGDIEPVPGMAALLVHRLGELNLLHRVDPSPEMREVMP